MAAAVVGLLLVGCSNSPEVVEPASTTSTAQETTTTTTAPTTTTTTTIPTTTTQLATDTTAATTTTIGSPPTTAPTVWRTTTADLDGDGVDEQLELSGGFLDIDGTAVPMPGHHPEEWTELFIVDVLPADGRLEAAVLRWIGEDEHDLVLVAWDGSDWHWDRPVWLANMAYLIFDGAVLDGRIEGSSTNCGTTIDLRYEYGELANLIVESTTFTDADPEPCFG